MLHQDVWGFLMKVEDVLLAEFKELSQIVRERAKSQHQLMTASLVTSSAIMGLFLGEVISYPQGLSAIPLMSSILGLMWVDHAVRQADIWNYLAHDLIPELSKKMSQPVLRWRAFHYLPREGEFQRPKVVFGKAPFRLRRWSFVLGSAGPFVIPSLSSIALLLTIADDPISLILSLAGFIMVCLYIIAYVKSRRRITNRITYTADDVKKMGLDKVLVKLYARTKEG